MYISSFPVSFKLIEYKLSKIDFFWKMLHVTFDYPSFNSVFPQKRVEIES